MYVTMFVTNTTYPYIQFSKYSNTSVDITLPHTYRQFIASSVYKLLNLAQDYLADEACDVYALHSGWVHILIYLNPQNGM